MHAGCSGFGRNCPENWFKQRPQCRGKAGLMLCSNELSRQRSVALLALVLVAILLDPSDPQARHSAAVDRALPAGEFLEAERIALAGFVDAEQAAGDRGDDLRLAANDPARRAGRRQRIERQRLAERSDDLGRTNLLVLEHSVTPA